jgi:prefoldin subunit 5
VSQIYASFEIKPDDTREERMHKLYLGIISIGEDLYCKGAAVAELAKQCNELDRQIAQMRRELAKLNQVKP